MTSTNNVRLGSNWHAPAPSLKQQPPVTVGADHVVVISEYACVEGQTFQGVVFGQPNTPDVSAVVYVFEDVQGQPIYPLV